MPRQLFRLRTGTPNVGAFNQQITMPGIAAAPPCPPTGACELSGPHVLTCFSDIGLGADYTAYVMGVYGASESDTFEWEYSSTDELNHRNLTANLHTPTLVVLSAGSDGGFTVSVKANGISLGSITLNQATAECPPP